MEDIFTHDILLGYLDTFDLVKLLLPTNDSGLSCALKREQKFSARFAQGSVVPRSMNGGLV
jgi:hypothetical protein